jgi:hypothetical protein
MVRCERETVMVSEVTLIVLKSNGYFVGEQRLQHKRVMVMVYVTSEKAE